MRISVSPLFDGHGFLKGNILRVILHVRFHLILQSSYIQWGTVPHAARDFELKISRS